MRKPPDSNPLFLCDLGALARNPTSYSYSAKRYSYSYSTFFFEYEHEYEHEPPDSDETKKPRLGGVGPPPIAA